MMWRRKKRARAAGDASPFAYECARSWESLEETQDPGVRHCDRCDLFVHSVDTVADARARVRVGADCVALRSVQIVGRIASEEDSIPEVAWLVPLDGPRRWSTLRLLPPSTTIGAAESSHIVVSDPGVGPEHCRVITRSGHPGFALIDGGSALGTFVNGERVQEFELVDGDVILVGETRMTFKSTS